jgi:predicted nucleotidyltransferase
LEQLFTLCREFFQKRQYVTAVYLHGSIPQKGQGHDLDVAVFSKEEMDEFRMGSELENWLGQKDIRIPVDLKDMSQAPIWAQFQVIKEGTRVYERNLKEVQDLEFWIVTQYLDFKPLMEEYDREMIKRLLARSSPKIG